MTIRVAVSSSVLALSLATATLAHAQRKEQCIADFEEGQDLREKLKLVAARTKLRACAQDACPVALRKDCLHAVEEVTRDLPTVTLGARDASGQDLPHVKIAVDDQPLVLEQPGASVPLDPGNHVVRFEHEGFTPLRREVLIRMGDRNREVVVTLERPVASVRAIDPAAVTADEPRSSSRRTWGLVVGGVGVLGLGGFGFFGITGKNEKDRLQHTCSPTCSDAQVSWLKTRYIAADVSLGVGVVALAVATYLLLTPESPRPALRQSLLRNIWK